MKLCTTLELLGVQGRLYNTSGVALMDNAAGDVGPCCCGLGGDTVSATTKSSSVNLESSSVATVSSDDDLT